MLFLGIFDQKCLIWVFLGKAFKKVTVIFEISTLKFVYLQNFTEKQKCLNLEPKMPYLGNFGLEFQKITVIFEINTLKFVKNDSLIHTVNFGRESVFLKCPGIHFF